MIRFFSAIILILVALSLQFMFGGIAGAWINFPLGVLVAAAFFLRLAELLASTFVFLLVVNWQSAPSPELFAFMAPPIGSFLLKDFLPWNRFINFSVLFFASSVFLYFIFAPEMILGNFGVFFADLVFGFAFGAASFKILKLFSFS